MFKPVYVRHILYISDKFGCSFLYFLNLFNISQLIRAPDRISVFFKFGQTIDLYSNIKLVSSI